MSDLNPDTLGKYDALVIYANTTQISKDQEEGPARLRRERRRVRPPALRLVLLPELPRVHRAGRRPVPEARHRPVRDDGRRPRPSDHQGAGAVPHLGRDLRPHQGTTKDRHVLQTRDDQTGSEPWTWTRTQGKGRVFYTAYGHDARTWGHPGFHDLVERGIRWAANKGDVYDSRPRVAKGLKPFEYEKAEIPLYTPGARWGTLGEPIRKMQKPLDPAESQKHLALPEGFEAKLFVAEPQIFKPIAMTWDHLGRLYVAETLDYPNEMQPKGKGPRPDLDRRGYRRRRQGRQGLPLRRQPEHPDSLCYVNGGLIVAQAPDMLFLKDTDGDGKADERKVLFTGLRHPRHPRRPVEPALRAGQLDLRHHRLFRLRRRGRRRAAQLPPGVLPVQAGRLEAGVPPQHEQQLVGRRHQRGGAALRLDGQRLPERVHADPESLLRVGPRDVARGAAEHRRLEPLLPDHRERPPGRLARRLHRRRRLGALHRPHLSRSSTGTGRRSSPSRPGTSSRRSR